MLVTNKTLKATKPPWRSGVCCAGGSGFESRKNNKYFDRVGTAG